MDKSRFEKPLLYCSMQEFVNLLNERERNLEDRFQELLSKTVSLMKADQPMPDDTVGIEEACKITGLKQKSIYSKVSRLELPSISRGRPLMFSRAELQLWMKLGKPCVAELELKRRKGELE